MGRVKLKIAQLYNDVIATVKIGCQDLEMTAKSERKKFMKFMS